MSDGSITLYPIGSDLIPVGYPQFNLKIQAALHNFQEP